MHASRCIAPGVHQVGRLSKPLTSRHCCATTTPTHAPLLIDCLTLWLTHVLEGAGAWSDASADAEADHACAAAVDELVAAWRGTRCRVIAVSNDVGSGVVPEYSSGRRFRDELGTLNARLAADSDEVLFVEAGIPRSLLHAGTAAS